MSDLLALLDNRYRNWGAFGATFGDSLVAGSPYGSSAVIRATWNGRYRILQQRQFAAGGKKVSEMIAEQLPGLLASGARFAIGDGGVNDLAQGVPEATVRNNLIDLWGRIQASNIMPFDLGMPPSSTGSVIGGVDERILFASHEHWRQQFCMRNGIPHIHYWSLIAHPNGNFAAGMNSDTRHPSASGMDLMAGEIVNVFDDPDKLYPFLELLDRPAAATVVFPSAVSFGGVASAIPSGYAATGGAGPAFSVVGGEGGSFGNWLSADYSGIDAVLKGFKGTQRSLAQLGWSVGDRIAFGCELRFTSATIKPRILLNSGDVTFVDSSVVLNDELGSGNPLTARFVYGEAVIAAGTNFNVGFLASCTGTGSMQIRRPVVYNLTKNGLS